MEYMYLYMLSSKPDSLFYSSEYCNKLSFELVSWVPVDGCTSRLLALSM